MTRAGGLAAAAVLLAMASHVEAQTSETARIPRPKPMSGPYQWTGGHYTYDPAGNVIGIDQQAFRYDPTGRLVTASVLSPDESPSPNYYSSRGYGYDPYGNMTSKTADGVQTNIAVNSSSNQLSGTGVSYDAAGNLTNLTYAGYQHVYAYDALSSQKSETITNLSGAPTMYHVYSPSDERLLVADTGTNVNTWTIRDLSGNPIRQIENNTSASTWLVRRDYSYRAGVLLEANVVAESRQEHYTVDHLSTPRLITNASAQVVGYHVYLPFGEEWFPPSSSAQEGSPKKFTGHERDRDLANYAADPFSLDYMHARFYASQIGRFLTIDPSGKSGNALEPQSWNRYSYARDTPVTALDRDGKETVVFVVSPSNIFKDLSGGFGHTAVWVSAGGHSNGWSFGGAYAFKKDRGYADLVRSYVAEGRTVHVFHIKTTAAQDAKMLKYINENAPTDFKICTHNCTTTTWEVLQEGGVVPKTVPVYCGYCGITEMPTHVMTPEGMVGALTGQYANIVRSEEDYNDKNSDAALSDRWWYATIASDCAGAACVPHW